MPNVTENYGLKKPRSDEFYDVNIQNDNMDIIDEELKKRATLGENGKVPPEQLPDTTFIPVTSEVPEESDIWIDPNEESVEDAHITNYNNPHNVTIEQIGAAPVGDYATKSFVSNEIAKAQLSGSDSDIDLSGYATKDDLENLTASDVGARPNTWMPTATQVGARPNTWMPTYSDVGAAPNGYGLGTGCRNADSVLNINANGWWLTKVETPNGDWWFCHAHVTNQADDMVVEAISLDGLLKCRRTKREGVWGVWEWVTPYLAPGAEYRTTERYNGKVVYAKHYNAGKFVNNGYFTLPSGAVDVIRYEGYFGASKRLLPIGRYCDSNANYYAYLSKEVSETKVFYTYQKGFTDGANDLFITVYYTKD